MSKYNQPINKNREVAVMREYANLASKYDKRWAFYINATVCETLKRLDINESDKLLDIGCGTGSLLQTISSKYPSVTLFGVDISAEMLKVAHNKQISNCTLVCGESQCLPFHSKSFDIVVTCNAFHYWHKPNECLREIARILKPQGKIVITDWCDDYITCRICDFFLRLLNRAHFRTYGLRTCERILQDTGYTHVQSERYKISLLWGLMTVKAKNQ